MGASIIGGQAVQDWGGDGVKFRCVLRCTIVLLWFSLVSGCASVKPAFEDRPELEQRLERVPAARLEIETGESVSRRLYG